MELARIASFLADNADVKQLVEALEASRSAEDPMRVSEFVNTKEWAKWCQARRIVSYLLWDVYAACAIQHYRVVSGNSGLPLINEKGVVTGRFSESQADRLLKSYLECKTVLWRDDRPKGYSYDPFADEESAKQRDKMIIFRELSSECESVINDLLAGLSAQVEAICGHYWSAGAARLFCQKPGEHGGFHSDRWPLALKKIMIYPAGAGEDLGSTEFILPSGEHMVVAGGRGTWALFDNTMRIHRALAPKREPRPTIEITVVPAFRTEAKLASSGIHVGFPWLPPDIGKLNSDTCPDNFSGGEVEVRTLLRTAMIALTTPEKVSLPRHLVGLGAYDL